MTRQPYVTDPGHTPPPAWLAPLVFAWAASAGFAIARVAIHVTTRRKP